MAQPVLISEFLAINDGVIEDEDTDNSDFIELHNAGTSTVDLDGWALTDDPADLFRWLFPPLDLPPGGYLLVFASEKDRRDPASELHTNFRLLSTGDITVDGSVANIGRG